MSEDKKITPSNVEEKLQRRRKMELMMGVCDLIEGESLGTTTFRGAPCYVVQMVPGSASAESIVYLPYNDTNKLNSEMRSLPPNTFKDEDTVTYEHGRFLIKHGSQYFQEKLVIRTSGVDEVPRNS